MSFGIIELLTRVGEDHVGVQFLAECASGYRLRRDGVTLITFGTLSVTPAHALNDTGPIGVIVWLPRDLVERAKAAHDAEVTT